MAERRNPCARQLPDMKFSASGAMLHHMKRIPILISPLMLLVLAVGLMVSCAGEPDAKTTVRSENKVRAYERFLKDHTAAKASDIEKAGIHYSGRYIYVVISLTDSGGDRYPEWAAERLTTTLYGYRAVDQTKVSDDEFFELVLRFELESIVEGKYENLARIRIREKDVKDFVEMHLEGI